MAEEATESKVTQEEGQIDRQKVVPVVYRRGDDGYIYFDFLRPLIRLPADRLEAEGENKHRYIARTTEVLAVTTARQLLEYAEKVDYDKELEIQEFPVNDVQQDS